jgi:hypothetical protein
MAAERSGLREEYSITIRSLNGFEFRIIINDKSDLELAEDTIEYVMGKIRQDVRFLSTEPPTTVS